MVVFGPLVAISEVVRGTNNMVSNLPELVVDKGVAKALEVIDRYGKGDPEILEKVEPAMRRIVQDVLLNLSVLTTVQKVGNTLAQGIAYFIALGDAKTLAIALALAICDVLQIPTVLSGPFTGLFIRMISGRQGNQQPQTLSTEAEDDLDLGGVLTAMWQSVSVIFGITQRAPENITEFFAASYKSIDTAARSTRGLLTLFSLVSKCIYKMYVWCLDKVNGTNHSNHLLCYNKDLTQRWAKEVYTLIDPVNEPRIMNSVKWFERLQMAVRVGQIINSETAQVGLRNVPPNFGRMMEKLQDLYVKAVNVGYATSTRREPVCVWVSGAPGIGKTHMKDHMVLSFLKANNIVSTGNPVYTHTSGTKHWTGVKNKTVVLFDDFSTVEGETLESDISDLMRLVSDARFCPDQAAIEDKGTPVAPALVYVNCNESHPSYNAVRDRGAFLRRRHVVVEATLTKDFTFENLESPGARAWVDKHATEDNRYPHLLFTFLDPMHTKRTSGAMTFPNFFKEFMKRTTEKYNLNDTTYRYKLLEFEQALDEQMEMPFADLLEQFRLQSERDVKGTPLVLRSWLKEHFDKVYSVSERYAREASLAAKSMLQNICPLFGKKLSTEAADDADPNAILCVCLPTIATTFRKSRCIVDRVTGTPIKFCSDHCAMRSPGFWSLVESLPLLRRERELVPLAMKQLGLNFEQEETILTTSDSVEEVVKEITEVLADRPAPEGDETQTSAATVLLALSVVLIAGGGIYSLYRYMRGDKSDIQGANLNPVEYVSARQFSKTELVSSGDIQTRHIPRSKGIAIKYPKKTELLDAEYLCCFEEIIDRNTCYIILDGVDKTTQKKVVGMPFRCLGICGTYVIALKHYINKIKRTEDVELRFVNGSATLNLVLDLNKTKISELVDSEVVVLELPANIPSFRDIRTHFMCEEEAMYITNHAKIYEKGLGHAGRVHNVNIKVEKDLAYEDAGITYVAPQALSYTWHAPGRCMSPIYGKFTREKIIGFHICGGNGLGAGEPIVLETLSTIIKDGVLGVEMIDCKYLDNNSEGTVVLNSNLDDLGIVKPQFAVRLPDKSAIVPSLIHGYIEPKTRPAPLNPRDVGQVFSPLVTGVDKHGLPPKGFETHLLVRAQKFLQEEYMQHCIPVKEVDLLTEQEAVIGIPALDGYQAMELSTSEGFPYTATRPPGQSNKRYQFEIEEREFTRVLTKIDPAVRAIMESKLQLRERGVVPATVFTDCLKDARIANEKFSQPGKTRIFSISPTDFTIQFRQYFGDLLAAQKACRFNLEHMVGVNIHSLEWTKLGRLVQSKGPKVLCGDYSNFGPSLDPEVVSKVGEVWCNWYEMHEKASCIPDLERQRRRKVRSCMMEEMRMAVHLCGNILYRAPCGSPSGAPCTVNLNNDVNKMYIYAAWLACWEDVPLMCNFVAFRKHCVMFCYGDDIIINVSDDAAVKFNNIFLHEFFKARGIRYTDADKQTGNMKPYGSFAEASFLKAKWLSHPDHPSIFLPALDKASVEDCANWIRSVPDTLAATKQAVCDSLMLAYGQGQAYFEKHRECLLRAWNSSRVVMQYEDRALSLYTWEDMDSMRVGVVSELIEIDLDRAIAREHQVREQLKAGKYLSAGIMELVAESTQSDEFRKALRRLERKYEQLVACGIRVPAMERIIREYS